LQWKSLQLLGLLMHRLNLERCGGSHRVFRDPTVSLEAVDQSTQIRRRFTRVRAPAQGGQYRRDHQPSTQHDSSLAGGSPYPIYHLEDLEYKEGSMLSRRLFLAGSAAGGFGLLHAPPVSGEALLTEDGLYRQPWFLESLLELADDLTAASAKKKRFAIMWELRGCPYCKETHLVNFAKPEIENFVKEHFDILQLNIVGAREVTDFDGEKLPEKRLAEKYGVRYTPTFQFFPESLTGLADRKPREREVARAQGYLEPPHFLAMFRFVSERAYEKGSLREFLKANS